MTTPTPRPTGNSAGAQARADAGIVLPDTLSSKSQYGLGPLANAPVNVGGLMPVMTRDGKIITPDPKTGAYTAEQVMQAFASGSPAVVAQIQQQLMLGGFYSSADYHPNYGLINPEDLAAFKKATERVAQTGGSLDEYLLRQAKYGEYQGVAAAMSAQGEKPRTIQKADPLALGSLIERQFQQMTGRKPTDAEKAGFIAAYDTAYSQIQNDLYNQQEQAAGTAGSVIADPNYSTAPVVGDYDVNRIGPDRVDALNASLSTNFLYQQPQQVPGTAPGVIEQQDFDPGSFAERYVRDHATGESDAHDVATQFQSFLGLLGGIH